MPQLREAVAAYFTRRTGVTRAGSHVLVGPGSKELLFLTQLALDAELLVPSPSWVSYVPQAEILGRDVAVLLDQLGLTLPPQPPPKIRCPANPM